VVEPGLPTGKVTRRLVGVLLGSSWRAAPGLTAATVILGTIAAVGSVSFSLGYRLIVDAVTDHDGTTVAIGVGVVALLFTLSWVLSIIVGMQSSLLTDRVSLYIGERAGRLLDAAPGLEHFERPDLLREIDQLRDNRRMLAAANRLLLSAWQVFIRAVSIGILLATVYPPVLVVPLIGLIPSLADRRASRLQKESDDRLAPSRRLITDLFELSTGAGPAKELRTYGIGDAVARRHAFISEEVRRQSVRSALRSAAWEALGWSIYAFAFVAVIVILVLRAAHGHTSPGQVVMAVSLMRRAQTQVSSASDTVGTLATAVRTARRLLWLEDYVAALRTPANPLPVPDRLATGIRLEQVSFRYPGGESDVLHEINLTVPVGTTVAIIGENGAGKTTLAKLLTSMYQPTTGRILLDDVDLARIPPAEWRTRTTAAFQDFLRPHLVARDVVGIGELDRREDEVAVRAGVARAGAERVVDALPAGLDTPLGRSFTGGRELSGGQWQRLALARGLMRGGPLLTVFDEPTASLDAAAESDLFDRFARAAADGTGITVLVSHRYSTTRMADLIVVLENGRILESGSHDELMAAGGSYAELFSLQAKAYLSE
jgi:ATP-binding cassette subfamily B protein